MTARLQAATSSGKPILLRVDYAGGHGGGLFGLFGLDLLLAHVCIGYDTWRNHRLHPAFAFGAMLSALEDLPFIGMFLSSATWMQVATWFVS
jgi:hypothetical protein